VGRGVYRESASDADRVDLEAMEVYGYHSKEANGHSFE
jgi:hypothetical protein